MMHTDRPDSLLSETPPDVVYALLQLPNDRSYEVERDKSLRRIAYAYVRTHPKDEAILLLRKVFLFFVFDPDHEKGRRPIYWVPSVLLTLFAIYGAILRGNKIFQEDRKICPLPSQYCSGLPLQ